MAMSTITSGHSGALISDHANNLGKPGHRVRTVTVSTLLLVRHGLTEMTGPRLAGWTRGLGLDERGRAQAAALARRLAEVPLTAVVSSPLDRCLQTVEP